MTVIGEAFIAIRPTEKGFETELSRQVLPAGQKVAKTLATAIGGAFVVQGLRKFAQQGIAELEDAAAAQAQTAQAIKSTGGAANVTAEHIEDLAGRQLKLTGVDDELIQKGANLLLTFTGVRNEVGKNNDIFDRATVAALDLSRAGFGSVESASVLMGKALNDPVNGLTALQRVGVRLTDDQKALVKELVATGDTLGAQKVILEEVNKQVGGSAEAYGKTLPGQLAIARESIANTEGALLAGMAPALEFTAGAATFLTDQFAKQPPVLQQVEGGLLLVVGGLGSIITPLKSGIDLWRSFGRGAQAASAVADISGPVANSADAVGGLYSQTGKLNKATAILGGVALVGVVAGLAAWGQEMDGLHVDIDGLAKDLYNLDGATSAATDQGIKLIAATGDLKGTVSDMADTDGAAAQLLLDRADALGLTEGKTKELQGVIDNAREADVKGAAAKGKYAEEQAAATDAVTDGVSAEDAIAGATGEHATATGDAADALVGYEEKLEAARKAVDDLFASTESAIDADFRYRDAKDSTADALANLTELQKAGKGKTDEYRRAIDDAAETMYAQAQAAADNAAQQYELSGVTLDAADKATIQKRELEKLRDTLSPGSPLRARLQGMIDQLGRIPAKKETTVRVLTGQALVDIDRLARNLREKLIDRGIRVSVGGGGGLQLSAGGRVPMYLASGGGPRGTDTIPAWLTPDEHVVNAAAARRVGHDALDALNRGGGLGTSVTFGPGSVVVNPAPGMTPGEARQLGGALLDGAASTLRARGIRVLGRVQ